MNQLDPTPLDEALLELEAPLPYDSLTLRASAQARQRSPAGKQQHKQFKQRKEVKGPCMVYMLLHNSCKRFKIGLSHNPLQRLKNLPEAEEIDLQHSLQFLLPSRKQASDLERAMHTILSDYRIQPDQLKSGRFNDRGSDEGDRWMLLHDPYSHSRWPKRSHRSRRSRPSIDEDEWDGATEWFRCSGYGFAVSIFIAKFKAVRQTTLRGLGAAVLNAGNTKSAVRTDTSVPTDSTPSVGKGASSETPNSAQITSAKATQILTTLAGQSLTQEQLKQLMINSLEWSHHKQLHNLQLILDSRAPLPNSLESWVEDVDMVHQQLRAHLSKSLDVPSSVKASYISQPEIQDSESLHAIIALNAERMMAILAWSERLAQQYIVMCEPALPTSVGPSQKAVQTKDTSKDKNTTTPLHSVQLVGLIQSQTPLGISAMRFVSDPDSWTFQSIKGPVHLVQYTTHVETPLGTAKSIVFRPNALQLLGQLPLCTAFKNAWRLIVQIWRGAAVDPKSVLKSTDTQKQTTRRKNEQG